MASKKKGSDISASTAASLLAKRSVEARKRKWGKKEFVKKMREWGKLGGRPRKNVQSKQKGKG
jgi:hypothetical protein